MSDRIPSPPVNVQILDVEGAEHPCVVAFDGWQEDTGHALWTATPVGGTFDSPDPLTLTGAWRADHIPPNTLLRVSVNPPEAK